MSSDSIAREWQDGALLIVGSVLVGGAATGVLRVVGRPAPLLGVGTAVGATAVAFLALSYLCYGR
jgi:hypothetical protein